MTHILDVLKERGFLEQITFEEDLYKLLDNESVSFYIGFDPTANSLHAGSFIPIMAMMHMQRAGHRPIAVVGGGTTAIGDPSDRTDMRPMLSIEDIYNNADGIKTQLEKFLDFSEGKAVMVNNADWLLKLNYVDFIREIGAHFSVNKMLTAECYKSRLEKGLSFLEFNYMLMQAYDFLFLNRNYDCKLQMGGNDQWSNILAGADLIRRKEKRPAFACTFALLLNSEGNKMGKTQKGALWLDREKTTPYEFYQYWRNIADSDVEKCLSLLTFLDMDEVRKLGSLEGAEINEAKKILAYEVTKLVHGEQEAKKAESATNALFGGGEDSTEIPSTKISAQDYQNDKRLIAIMTLCGLTKTNGEGRRLVEQGGIRVDGDKVTDPNFVLNISKDEEVMIQKGKKIYHKVKIK